MRAFARYRAILIENEDLRSEIRAMDDKINKGLNYYLKKLMLYIRKDYRRHEIK